MSQTSNYLSSLVHLSQIKHTLSLSLSTIYISFCISIPGLHILRPSCLLLDGRILLHYCHSVLIATSKPIVVRLGGSRKRWSLHRYSQLRSPSSLSLILPLALIVTHQQTRQKSFAQRLLTTQPDN